MNPLCPIVASILVLSGLVFACSSAVAEELHGPGSPEGPYKGFGFEWENNDLGLGRDVPKPFEPVRRNGNEVTLWGRRYTFDDGLLPEQIVSQDVPMLARPGRLLVTMDGREISLQRGRSRWIDTGGDDRVSRRSTFETDDASIDVTMTLAYDGFQLYEIAVKPRGDAAPQLDKLVLELPFREEVGRFFSHYLYYDFDTQRIDRGKLTESAGAVGDGVARGFTNHFWVGDHRVGLELGFEENRHWSNANPERVFEVAPVDGAAVLRVTFVDKPIAVKSKGLLYRVSAMVNPYKPMMKDWRTMVICNITAPLKGYDTDLWNFTTMRVGPNFFIPLVYDTMPEPPHVPEARAEYDRVREKLERNGIRYIPYSALHSMDRLLPEHDKYWPWWNRNPDPNREKPDKGKRDTVTLYSKSIKDFLVWRYIDAIDRYGETALYWDWATCGKPVVNPRAGEFYLVPPKGIYKPIFSVHAFHRRMYKATQDAMPEYLITQHHSKFPMMFSTYSHMVYSGEALNVMFLRLGHRLKREGKLPEGHPPYVPDYSKVPDDFWLAVYHQGFGASNMFLSNITKAWNMEWMNNHPDDYARYTRTLLSRLVVLDTPAVRVRMYEPTVDRLNLGFQEHFGGLVDPIRFVHPLDASSYLAGAEKSPLKIGLYIRPDGRMALAVANWTDDPVTETLRLDFKGVGHADKTIRNPVDIEGGEAPKHAADTLTVTIPANDYRVYTF